jgi:hypothetical protein
VPKLISIEDNMHRHTLISSHGVENYTLVSSQGVENYIFFLDDEATSPFPNTQILPAKMPNYSFHV